MMEDAHVQANAFPKFRFRSLGCPAGTTDWTLKFSFIL